jgi:hypothetical protein
MYAMLCTRPDLAYAVSQISQYSSNPTYAHFLVAKRIFRYLNGSRNMGITFSGSKPELEMEAYCDADWASGEDRKSISGYVFIIGGGIVSWQSKKQPTVALSSTEGEYMAMTQTSKEILWIQQLLKDLGRRAINDKLLKEDNMGAIALAKNPQYHARTKHIDIQHHFIRQCLEDGKIELEYCPTEDMIADIMMKALSKEKHQRFMSMMGMQGTPSGNAKVKMTDVTKRSPDSPSGSDEVWRGRSVQGRVTSLRKACERSMEVTGDQRAGEEAG